MISSVDNSSISNCTHSGLRPPTVLYHVANLRLPPYLIARIADCDTTECKRGDDSFSAPYLIARIADCDRRRNSPPRLLFCSISNCTHSGLRLGTYLFNHCFDCHSISNCTHSGLRLKPIQITASSILSPYLIARIADCDIGLCSATYFNNINSISNCTHSGLRLDPALMPALTPTSSISNCTHSGLRRM